MRLRVISARNQIPNLNPNEKLVHMAFRASNVDFLNLMQRCPRLRMIQVPPSYRKAMSNAIQVFLDMQGIELLEGDGRATERIWMSISPLKTQPLRRSAPWPPAEPLWTRSLTRFRRKPDSARNLSSTSPEPRSQREQDHKVRPGMSQSN